MANLVNLLAAPTRVETPFIKVTIGEFTFGKWDQQSYNKLDKDTGRLQKITEIQFPNYVQSLNVVKVNGTVNQYTLQLSYPITDRNDPNFFEKVFGSVSKTRRIVFSYGDLSLPTYSYKDEEALITAVNSKFDMAGSCIRYTVKATSTSAPALSGNYTFTKKFAKPSDEIKRLLFTKVYGLQELFTGMRDKGLVEQYNLIESDDIPVDIEAKTNISILDYLSYLVSCMTPVGGTKKARVIKSNVYAFNIIDDTSGVFGGPYFKVLKIRNNSQMVDNLCSYVIDVGYPTANIVTDLNIDNNENYSIFYDYTNELNDSDYSLRINDAGEIEYVYAPILSSSNDQLKTTEVERSWWTKVTSYPIRGSITLKGLLRPAILMTYIKLNILFYGRKHIHSGYYIITRQEDQVDASGFKTTLNLTRIAGDSSEELL